MSAPANAYKELTRDVTQNAGTTWCRIGSLPEIVPEFYFEALQ